MFTSLSKTTCKRSALAVVILMVAAACGSREAPTSQARRIGRDGVVASQQAVAQPEIDGSKTLAGAARSEATLSTTGKAPTVVRDPGGGFVANLFTSSEDRVGITNTELRLCMHGGFKASGWGVSDPNDLDVYWRMVNAKGGVFGRKVRVDFQDDQDMSSGFTSAVNRCKSVLPFLILSNVGFDRIAEAREFVETNRQLYLYGSTTEAGSDGKQFSFAVEPTTEVIGKQVAQYMLTTHGAKSIGLVTRSDASWQGAASAFKSELAARQRSVAVERPIARDQVTFASEIQALKAGCPASSCVVFTNVEPAEFVALYQQASGAPNNYRPVWFNFAHDAVTDVGASAAGQPPFEAWSAFVGFDSSNTTQQPWFDEIQAMKNAYDTYCTGTCQVDSTGLGITEWRIWLSFKALHGLLLDCGNDCSRNRVVGELLSDYRQTLTPHCGLDFSRARPNFGSYLGNISRAVAAPNDKAVFSQATACQEGF